MRAQKADRPRQRGIQRLLHLGLLGERRDLHWLQEVHAHWLPGDRFPVYEEKITTSERSSKNSEFVENVAEINVKRSVKNIIERSFVLEQMLENGQIGIVGAMHDIETGVVTFYDDVMYIKDDFNPEFTLAALRH